MVAVVAIMAVFITGSLNNCRDPVIRPHSGRRVILFVSMPAVPAFDILLSA